MEGSFGKITEKIERQRSATIEQLEKAFGEIQSTASVSVESLKKRLRDEKNSLISDIERRDNALREKIERGLQQYNETITKALEAELNRGVWIQILLAMITGLVLGGASIWVLNHQSRVAAQNEIEIDHYILKKSEWTQGATDKGKKYFIERGE